MTDNSGIIIFQQHGTCMDEAPATAWRMTRNAGPGWSYPFTYSVAMAVGAGPAALWTGTTEDIAEGVRINSAIVSQVYIKLSLSGASSADIIMTGGGLGPDTTPFLFSLQNARYA
jgi:hypothetical protein